MRRFFLLTEAKLTVSQVSRGIDAVRIAFSFVSPNFALKLAR